MSKTLYVSNLGQQINLAELEDLFTTVGDVASKRLEMIAGTSMYEFGIIEMDTEQQASDCVTRFNGSEINGQALSVRSTMPRPIPPRVITKASTKGKPRKARRA
jgi:RNA recognition motif-containing protein